MLKLIVLVVLAAVLVDAAPKCDKFEEWKDSQPEETCDNPRPKPGPKGPKRCQCLPNCARHRGKCVPKTHCPPRKTTLAPTRPTTAKCGPNEEWNHSQPEASCANPNPKPGPQGPKRCQCLPICARHEGKCILKDKCPKRTTTPFASTLSTTLKQSTEPSTIASTASASSSRASTASPSTVQPSTASSSTAAASTAAPSTTRKASTASPSTARCGANEEWSESQPEASCDNPNPKPGPKGPKRCQCLPSCARHWGKCIPKVQCPPRTTTVAPTRPTTARCRLNEEWKDSHKEGSCDKPNPNPGPKGPKKCQCKPKCVRHWGKCIPKEKCPKRG